MKDAPRLSGFTACKPAESWRCQRQAGLSPTGGRPRRPGKAGSVGAWAGLLRGCLTFHASWVTRNAVEQLA